MRYPVCTQFLCIGNGKTCKLATLTLTNFFSLFIIIKTKAHIDQTETIGLDKVKVN